MINKDLASRSQSQRKIFWAGIIGNSLDHYDSALYIFLAPFLAPVFFPNTDPVFALILTYGIKSVGFFTRPAGAIFFGHLSRKYCIKKLLSFTLCGVALCTILIAFIPGTEAIGIFAPILVALIRAALGFFAAAEHNIAALFILEQLKQTSQRKKASSYYQFSTMMGTLLASIAAWLVSMSPDPTFYWRGAFLCGIFTGILGLYLRFQIKSYTISESEEYTNKKSIKVIADYKWKILKIIPISSFTYVTYSIPFIFLKDITNEITQIPNEDLHFYGIVLTTINNLLIPVFGNLVDRIDVVKWMATMSGILCLTIVPIFAILPMFGLTGIIIARLWVIVLGVAFVAPFNALLFSMVPGREKYIVSGFGYAIGTELFGKSATTICLALWYFSESLILPGIYVATVAFVTTLCLLAELKLSSAKTRSIETHESLQT